VNSERLSEPEYGQRGGYIEETVPLVVGGLTARVRRAGLV